jgi:hypothetical protein
MSWRDAIARTITGIRAYHGSPHDFERFDIGKIGTGEGAQAYGHGLYFAGNEDVARGYRNRLSDLKDRYLETGERLPYWVGNSLEAGYNPEELLKDFRGRLDEMRRQVADPNTVQPWNVEANIPGIQNVVKGIEQYQSGVPLKPAGRMYEVNINADPSQFLDWDKPIAQQKAYDALRAHWDAKIGDPDIIAERMGIAPTSPGGRLYSGIGGLTQNAEASSNMLREAGVPGIRYLDEGSRNARPALTTSPSGDVLSSSYPPPTHNYVVFDPNSPISMVDIMKKYGVVGAPTGTLGALAAQDQYQPQDQVSP